MSLILHVDGAKWRNHLATVLAESDAQVVPVIKGNGYGFGKKVLAQEAKALNLPVVAVATVAEAKEIESIFSFLVFHATPQLPSVKYVYAVDYKSMIGGCRTLLVMNSVNPLLIPLRYLNHV